MNRSSQADHYGDAYDYIKGSPHLRHRHLFEGLTGEIAGVLAPLRRESDSPSVLEVGAGDGSVTERLLALGCRVTATEMSSDSVAAMDSRFGGNDRLRTVLDEEGDLGVVGDSSFDLILFSSVLHHIPDYLSAVQSAVNRFLRVGGAVVSLQDPLWYPRMGRGTHRLSEAAYLTWRVTQGGLLRGLKTRTRRAAAGVSELEPADVVEYHVVRSGVDEEALTALLSSSFRSVRCESYWSSQGVPQQWLGETLGLSNTFALFAEGRLPDEPDPSAGRA